MLLLTLTAAAQTTGQLRLLMEPAGTTSYLLDGKHRMTQREVSLLEGPHHFVFWAPERRMLDTTITVVGGGIQDVRISLRYSEEYIQHLSRMKSYTSMQRWGRVVPPIVAGAAGVWALVSYLDYNAAHKDLVDLRGRVQDLLGPGGNYAAEGRGDPRCEGRLPEGPYTDLRGHRTVRGLCRGRLLPASKDQRHECTGLRGQGESALRGPGLGPGYARWRDLDGRL